MNSFELEIFTDEGRLCTFYTVRWLDAEYSETDKFLLKFKNLPELNESLQNLVSFIFKKIANETGALQPFFRFENRAEALPPSGGYFIDEIFIDYANFPLRLYCLRICDSLVILFNGAAKTSKSAQDGETSMVFAEANLFAKRITQAIREKTIYITDDYREFRNFNHSTEIIL